VTLPKGVPIPGYLTGYGQFCPMALARYLFLMNSISYTEDSLFLDLFGDRDAITSYTVHVLPISCYAITDKLTNRLLDLLSGAAENVRYSYVPATK